MIKLFCETVTIHAKGVVALYGTVEPAPMKPQPKGTLDEIFHTLNSSGIRLGQAFVNLPKSTQSSPLPAAEPAEQRAYVIAIDDMQQLHEFKASGVRKMQYNDGGLLFEVTFPGSVKKLKWLLERDVYLIGMDEYAGNGERDGNSVRSHPVIEGGRST